MSVGLFLAVSLGTASTSLAQDESPTPITIRDASDIASIATRLGEEEPVERARALETLTRLPLRSLPAITARVEAMRQERVRSVLADIEMTAFRELAEAEQPDADIPDLIVGVLARLQTHRSTPTLRMAERVALLRSVERIATPEAGQVMLDIIGRDYLVWRWEAARVARRSGLALLPTLISARGHPNRRVHRWGVFHARRQGATSPGAAVQLIPDEALPALLRAYAAVRDQGAIPIAVTFLADRRIAVREAARDAIISYERNAIWQLRRAYRNHAHRPAPSSWDAERTLSELWEVLELRRFEPYRARFEEGQRAREAGDFDEMHRAFETTLAAQAAPPVAEEMADGYAELADNALEREEFPVAAWAYRRAARLGHRSASVDRWEAQAAFAEAEERLRQGLIDLDAYEAVLELDADHEPARLRIEELADGGRAPAEKRRAWAGTGASALLFLFAATMLRRREPEVVDSADGDELDADPMNDEEREA